MRCVSYFLLALLFLIAVPLLHARIIHVPGDSSTIQGGINGAVEGDTVMVEPGTYYEHDIDFLGKAITVTGTAPEDSTTVVATVVDANSLSHVFFFHSEEDSMSILKGFTIINGYGDYGGGIYCDYSSPTISNNLFMENTVSGSGGGGAIYCYFSNPVITDNIFIENWAGYYGAGVYCWDSSPFIARNLFKNNTTSNGGGVSCRHYSNPMVIDNAMIENVSGNGGGIHVESATPIIMGNRITGNSAGKGGGIYLENASPTISNNLITDNLAQGGLIPVTSGGGIHCYASHPNIINNVIAGNSTLGSGVRGGGVYCSQTASPNIENNLIVDNWSDYYGGGLYLSTSYPTISNNTIVGNVALVRGGGLYCAWSEFTITNSIFWGNISDWGSQMWIGRYTYPSTVTIRYSDVQEGERSVVVEIRSTLNWGSGMITADPLFRSFRGFDNLLGPDSPCIDTGAPALEDGFEWPDWYPNGTRSDMGAYGGPGNAGWLP